MWTPQDLTKRAVWIVAATLALLLQSGTPGPGRVWRASLGIDDQSNLNHVLAGGYDVVGWVDDRGTPRLEVLVRSTELRRLRQIVRDVQIVEMSPGSRAPAPPQKSMAAGGPPNFGQGAIGGYYSWAEVGQLLDHYAVSYPAVVGPKVSIGTSVEGRPIWAVKVSDNPGTAEAEPRVLIDALHHAREPTSMQSAIYLLDVLATGYGVDPEITDLVDAREIWFVPVVNPDGYVFNETTSPSGGGLWRKNRRVHAGGCIGVDLNRNYPFQWGVDDLGSSPAPCSESYRGAAPLSEPESLALDQFVAQQGFAAVCSLHAHGRQILYPFGYAPITPASADGYAEHAIDFADPSGYLAGSIQDVLQLPANGNAVDHHHAMHGARAWTIEVGGDFWPPVAEMAATAISNQETLLRLIRYAGAFVVPTRVDPIELAGDGDGYYDPGELIGLHVDLRTRGIAAPSSLIVASIQCADPAIQIQQGSVVVPASPAFTTTTIAAGGSGGLSFSVAPGAAPGKRVTLTLTIQWDGFHTERPIEIDLGTPRLLLLDDVESDLGWSLVSAGDNAFTGRWVLDDPDPVIQDGEFAQPDDDWTPGAGKRCFITGNFGTAPGQDDVDDGTTTLTTPGLDLSAALEPRIRYQRYYWCSKVDDPFRVEISADDGKNWTPVETVMGRRNQWTERTWRVEDFVPKSDRMRLRFIATDPTNNSVTEALIDQLEVLDFATTPHAGLMGTMKPGGQVELQVAAVGGSAWVLAAPALAPAGLTLPGVSGVLLLDPSSLVLLAPVPVSAGTLTRLPVTLPTSASGATVFLQVLQLSPLALSPIVTSTLP